MLPSDLPFILFDSRVVALIIKSDSATTVLWLLICAAPVVNFYLYLCPVSLDIFLAWSFVQRLSRTMKTVAKGILKDHLVLVANSMTCTGNLNGFHNGGYKATFRSLKVQVPFTEATLLVSSF